MKVPEQVVKTGMSLAEAIQSNDKNKTRVIITDNIGEHLNHCNQEINQDKFLITLRVETSLNDLAIRNYSWSSSVKE